MWLIVLIIALSNVERGYKLLEPFIKKPNMQGMLPATTSSEPSVLPSVKSGVYVPSSVEDQQELIDFEAILTALKPRTDDGKTASAMSATDNIRWTEATCPPIAQLPESVMNEVSKLIMFSNSQIQSCEGAKELVKDALFGIKTNERIIFGFRMKLEVPSPCSAAQFRIKIHKTFYKSLWPVIKSFINFSKEDREIIFVGYESGGALASLAAWQVSKQFEKFNTPGLIVSNGNNQIKVITWDEMPLYTIKTAQKYPILARNHFRFTTNSISESKIRLISQFSGGIDEVQYFATNGEEIKLKTSDYNDFATRLTAAINTSDSSDVDSDVTKWNPLVNLALFLKSKHLREMEQERLDKLKELLSLHRDHLSIINSVIFNTFNSFLHDTKLAEPNSCAIALANQLTASVFGGDSVTVRCRVDSFNVVKGTFKIFCAYKTAETKPLAQFLSFDAVLGDAVIHETGNDCQAFMEEVEIENPKKQTTKKKKHHKKKKKTDSSEDSEPEMIKVRKYSGPPPTVDTWSSCLYHLFSQRPHIAELISPYHVKEKRIYPHCSYLPFDAPSMTAFASSTRVNAGCYLRSPNIGHELLQIYRADPLFFYRSIDPTTMIFPDRCHKLLFHIPFKVDERPRLSALQQVSSEYLTQLVGRTPIEKTEVTLWTPRDTDSYKTIAYFGTDNISTSDLSDRSFYAEDFENSIIKCLSSPAFPYRDCTTPLNRWIPMACPKACSRTHGDINFLCRQVKSCPTAGYYIGLSQEGGVEELRSVKDTLQAHPNPQFGFFHVQTRRKGPLSDYFSSINFNVALFRIPA